MHNKTCSLFIALISAAAIEVAYGSDILVVVDSSGSMQERTTDGIPRIDAAKSALLKLPPSLTNHEVGVLLFGHRKTSREPGACQDIELKLPIQPFSEPEYQLTVAALLPRGATPIANSLLKARDILLSRDKDTDKSVILVTDGNETCHGDPVGVAKSLREAGFNIKVHVVGFGVNPQQEIQLKAIAIAGGGEYLLAKDAIGLSEALPTIVKTALRTTKIEELARNELVNETFDNEILGEGWKVIRPDEDRYAVADGELLIVTQYNGDEKDSPRSGNWHDDAKTKNLVQWKTVLEADDFEVSVDLNFQASALGQGAALQLRKDDHQAVELALVVHPYGNNIERKFQMSKILDGRVAVVYNSLATGQVNHPEQMTLKIVKRGIVFVGYVKIADPKTGEVAWREVGMQAVPGFDRVFPTLKAANSRKKKPEATAAFDNFVAVETVLQRTVADSPPENTAYYTVFDNLEEFQKDFEVLDEVDTHYGLKHGLNIVSQFGELGDEKNPLKNVVLLNRPLPEGDYEIEIQARTRLTNQNSDVGIVLFQDHDTAVYLGHAAFGGGGYNYHPQFQFEKVLQGKRSGPSLPVAHVRGKEITVLFKIVKRGRTYSASVYAPTEKEGEMAWLPVGEQSLLRFKPRLGFYAWNRSARTYGSGPAHEVNILFERAIVRKVD